MSSVAAAPVEIESIIRSAVEAKVADKGSVKLVAEMLRQVFVDGQSVDDVVNDNFLPRHIFEGYVKDVQAVLGKNATTYTTDAQNATPSNVVTPQDSATDCDSDDDLSLRLEESDDDLQEDAELPSGGADQLTPNGTGKNAEGRPTSEPVSEKTTPSSKPLKSYGKAVATPDGCVAVQSKRFPGVVLQFRPIQGSRGPKPVVGVKYRCGGCFQLAEKFDRLGVSMRSLRVVDGEIVDREPDNAGTSHGHLCLQSEVLKQLEEEFAQRRRSGRERRTPQAGDATAAASTTDSGSNEGLSGSRSTPASSAKRESAKKRCYETKEKANTDTTDRSTDGETPPPTAKRVRFAKALKTPKVEREADTECPPKVDENVPGDAATSKDNGAATEANGHGASMKPTEDEYLACFGKAIKTDDPSVVLYDNIFGSMYTFKLVHQKEVVKGGVQQVIRTYRCEDCVQAAQKQALKVDVPLVKTIDDVFVERDPDQPLGNSHFCMM
ncbi:hypothetical protein AAVH_25303 [Aphelenchoides avenae]|nr:hypothetical protein AAVH_25303 [Aphelenchus avenae]